MATTRLQVMASLGLSKSFADDMQDYSILQKSANAENVITINFLKRNIPNTGVSIIDCVRQEGTHRLVYYLVLFTCRASSCCDIWLRKFIKGWYSYGYQTCDLTTIKPGMLFYFIVVK